MGVGSSPEPEPEPEDSYASAFATSDEPTELGMATSARRSSIEPTWPTIGRYRLSGRLGAGAMGTVFEALDPSLDRPVAIKVLHAEMPVAARHRMQREATALARLSDPHVVQVFEVGEDHGQTFIAMELVRGQTLAEWIRREPRPAWSEIIDVYAQAGAGLAAAHAAGLVHRDFKPGNCIMGDDGRVRVVDFGLAKDVGQEDEASSEDDELTATTDAALTQHGMLLGTPAYMAPELLGGQPGSAAGDQFALCVSLWEALHGQRPFVGDTLAELTVRILDGRIAEPPEAARVPRWLRAIVERGMSVEPARRWPSMEALVDALAHGRAGVRRRALGWALGVVAATAAAIVGWRHHEEVARIEACDRAGREVDEVWNADVARSVREALTSTGMARAEITADKLTPWLEAQAGAWAAARTEVCLGAEVEGTWDADALERAQWCLEERRAELEAFITELGAGRPETVDDAVWSASNLRRVEPCRDRVDVSRLALPPEESRETVRSIRAELLRASSQWAALEHERAIEINREAVVRAEALAWPPLVAEAHLYEAGLLERQGKYAEAGQRYEDAFFEAAHASATEEAATAAGNLVEMARAQQRLADAVRWSRHEDLWVSHLPDVAGLWRAQQLDRLATVLHDEGKLAEAKATVEEAIAIAEKELGPTHVKVAVFLGHLAIVHKGMGELSRARALLERAIRIEEQALGPEHPQVGGSLNNLGNILLTQGNDAEAIEVLERAIRIAEQAKGVDHIDVAAPLSNLALIHRKTGDTERAIALYEQELSILRATMGPNHPEVARGLANLANCYADQGETERAHAIREQVVPILQEALGPEHPDVAIALINVADTTRKQGRLDEARAQLEQALRIFEKALGSEHLLLGTPLQGLALIALSQDRAADAVAASERGLRVMEAAGIDPASTAQARFVLARALDAAGQDSARARALAEQALATHRERGMDAEVKRVEQWLAERAE